MGYNATVVILCDQLHQIENDPSFGKKLAEAIRSFGHHKNGPSAPYVPGQTQVIDVEHADAMQIVAVGGNTGRVLGYDSYAASDDSIVMRMNQKRLSRQREARAALKSRRSLESVE